LPQLLYFQVFVVFHASHHSHRFGLFSRYFPDFFSHFFSPESVKNAGISGGILLILDSWAMGHDDGNGFQTAARVRRFPNRSHESNLARRDYVLSLEKQRRSAQSAEKEDQDANLSVHKYRTHGVHKGRTYHSAITRGPNPVARSLVGRIQRPMWRVD
jgi:hypothetical protein